jgi:hypothetical protein
MIKFSGTILLATAACTAGSTPTQEAAAELAPTQCAAGPLAAAVSPSREGFFREVLFAAPTARTPRFDDYTPGSYHVDKLDLADGLPSEAARCGVRLRAVLVLGPVGPMWAFHVIAFIQDGDSLRINSLVMPHARITGKGTGRIDEARLTALIASVTGSPLVRAGRPVFADTVTDPLARDFSYTLLLVVYDGSAAPRHWHGSLWTAMRGEDSAAVVQMERLTDDIDAVLKSTTDTYPDPPRQGQAGYRGGR